MLFYGGASEHHTLTAESIFFFNAAAISKNSGKLRQHVVISQPPDNPLHAQCRFILLETSCDISK